MNAYQRRKARRKTVCIDLESMTSLSEQMARGFRSHKIAAIQGYKDVLNNASAYLPKRTFLSGDWEVK